MAEQETRVRIVAWPPEPAALQHRFDTDTPCPVALSFDRNAPAHVFVQATPEQPLHVDMNMNVTVKETIPVCLKIGDPICARSEYTVGITIFDHPVATITVRGLAELFHCQETPPEPTCVNFRSLQPGQEFPQPETVQQITFRSLGSPLRTVTYGAPPGQIKLAFPDAGLRIEFPQPVSGITLTVNNYGNASLDFSVYGGATLLSQFAETIANTVTTVSVPQAGVTAVEIRGGRNEAAVVEVCCAAPPSPLPG